ncbi:MAG: hypothetical protein A2W18_08655 [Candidatus Muproteobacteria bacterium RBG_16_60_9]|uniref:Type II secretion system protein N n=1 Tax=Candidatus Muproteobacteria bacterium RBG_16_60_9 TaxID=1817755 RepID=A0A1F6VH90_9PROT|nr:MAG: hypothetical protein A2W18_08655 [Candidatus Muproteobacteria bacterium RBG_16_60_9]
MTIAARLKPAAGYIVLGSVLYLVFLVATAPAVLFAEVATRFSDGAIRLSQASGTFWRGSAQLHAGAPAMGVRELGRFQWDISPWWLFVGRAQFGVQLDGPSVRGQAQIGIGLSFNRFRIEALEASAPASIVSLVYGPAAFFEPTGTIEVRAPNAELSADGLDAKIEAQWRGAGGRFTGATNLGDYRLDITGNGANATIRLTTLRGDLNLNGQGTWNVTGDGAIQFTGRAQPRGDSTQLEPLLRALGRDLGGGQRQIQFNARAPLVQQLGL